MIDQDALWGRGVACRHVHAHEPSKPPAGHFERLKSSHRYTRKRVIAGAAFITVVNHKPAPHGNLAEATGTSPHNLIGHGSSLEIVLCETL